MIQEFISFHENIKEELDHVMGFMGEPMNDDPQTLMKNLFDCEAWYARMGSLLAEANSYLDRASLYYLPQREDGKTELDRTTRLEADVANVRQVRDVLESLCEAIKQRISLGQSVLSYARQFPWIK